MFELHYFESWLIIVVFFTVLYCCLASEWTHLLVADCLALSCSLQFLFKIENVLVKENTLRFFSHVQYSKFFLDTAQIYGKSTQYRKFNDKWV